MKVITAFAVAMFVAMPAFAQTVASGQDIESIYANEGAIAADQAIRATDQARSNAEQQQIAATSQAEPSQTGTGPYIDYNPMN